MAGEDEGIQVPSDVAELAKALEVLASPVRLALLQRLRQPAFITDLADEFRISRQAMKKHLDVLESLALVQVREARRGPLPASEYQTAPGGLFAVTERVRALGITVDPSLLPPRPTMHAAKDETGRAPPSGAGLLLVHGDQPGRWFPLSPKGSWVVGRDPGSDVALTYDPFASARHAMLRLVQEGWTVTDLHSTNGTRVNFRAVEPGGTSPLSPGDVLTVGKSHLLLRSRI